ncbi:PIG-L family deacetylase [Candidatus Berkelbacteria bacterium]|nr:PIG-L family deacetylase [Candidatus Berkelbacteria bacterium]
MYKLLHHALHLNTLRKLLGWATLQDAIRNRLQLEMLTAPPSGKVLVLAPHPDDDVFGCGGTLALHREQGDEIRVIYLCDGRSGSKRRTTELVQEELKKTRRAEAMAATGILQIPPGNVTFWGYRDSNLLANKTTTRALTQVLAEYVPSLIYVPHPNDSHPDHEATAAVLAQTLRAMGGDLPAEIWSYEVWQPLLANRLIAIEPVVHQKEQAILAHESQRKCRPYADAILGLNAYRGGMMGVNGPAEAFLALRPKLYLKLWDLLRGIVG